MVLKKGSDVSAFEKALDQAVGQRADVKCLVSKRSLEVRDLDETVTREEVVAALCIALGKPDLGDQCRLYKQFGGVETAVVRLAEVDARKLLGIGKLRVERMNCRVREHDEVVRCFRYQGYGHVSRGCTLPGRKDACWRCGGASHVAKVCKTPPRCLTCADRGTRMHHGGLGSLFVACVCTASTFLPTILFRSSRPRSSSLWKASEKLVGGPLSWATLIVSRPSGAKPVWAGESWSARWPLGMT